MQYVLIIILSYPLVKNWGPTFLSLFLSLLLYTSLSFCLRCGVSVCNWLWLGVRFQKSCKSLYTGHPQLRLLWFGLQCLKKAELRHCVICVCFQRPLQRWSDVFALPASTLLGFCGFTFRSDGWIAKRAARRPGETATVAMRHGIRSIRFRRVWKFRNKARQEHLHSFQVMWRTLGLQGTVRHCQFYFRVWRCRHFVDPMTGLCSKQQKDQNFWATTQKTSRRLFSMRPRSHSGVGTCRNIEALSNWYPVAHSYTYDLANYGHTVWQYAIAAQVRREREASQCECWCTPGHEFSRIPGDSDDSVPNVSRHWVIARPSVNKTLR